MTVALLVVFVVVFVAAGVLISRRQRARATQAPVTEIVAVDDGGRVTVRGRITGVTLSKLTAHLTGEPAVCSRAELTHRGQVVEVHREVPFRIVDDSGEAHVGIKDAVVRFGDRTAEARFEGDDLPGWARRALERDGLAADGEPVGRVDVVERLLVPGDVVTVTGVASSKADPTDPGRRHVVILPDPELGVVVTG